MSPCLKAWWQKWWFGFAFAGLLIFFELVMLAVPYLLTPAGYRWLGDISPRDADAPVYISYLGQSKSSWLLSDLYSDLPQTPRLDPFWSLSGLLVKAGIDPFVAYETLRWVCTLVLALTIYATAKQITQKESQARLASFIIANGMGAGWIYALIVHILTRRVLIPLPPDLTSFFAVSTTLLGGAHLILALALQIILARLIWICLTQKGEKKLLLTCLSAFLLAAIQPYYLPLIGLISLISLLIGSRRGLQKVLVMRFVAINAAMLPALAYFVWIAHQDKAFGQRFLADNFIPLQPPIFWIIALALIVIALIGSTIKRIPVDYKPKNSLAWVLVWIFSAIICLLLPFPWKGKYTQGLLPTLAILTMPFWLSLSDSLKSKQISLWRSAIGFLFLSAPFLYLILGQCLIARTPDLNHLFYQPSQIFDVWQSLRDQTGHGTLLTSDMTIALWTPAQALTPVWLGHKRETPEADQRYAALQTWRSDPDKAHFNSFLVRNDIRWLLATDKNDEELYTDNLDKESWAVASAGKGATLWQRK